MIIVVVVEVVAAAAAAMSLLQGALVESLGGLPVTYRGCIRLATQQCS